MNRNNPVISIIFSVILTFGITLSITHFHIVDFQEVQTQHQISELNHQCVLCGSVIKYVPQLQFDVEDHSISNISYFVYPIDFVYQPFQRYKSGRAPPTSPVA